MPTASDDWTNVPEIPYSEAIQDGKAPLFVTQIERDGSSEYIVRCADGSLAKLVAPALPGAVVTGIPTTSRNYLRSWIERIEGRGTWPARVLEFKRRLLSDNRMSQFWDWFEGQTYAGPRILMSSCAVSDQIWRSTRLPGKPSDMTPAQRSAYFDKVRTHVRALVELLRNTRFDVDTMDELGDKELSQSLDRALFNYGDDEDEEGHVVAFTVRPDGKYRHNYNYPESALVNTLHEVDHWTYWEDQWDGSWFTTSAPIVQANSQSTRVVYFNCTMHDWFRDKGLDIPFPVLATLANVALDLPLASQVEEDSVRKQVRRYQARQAKLAVERVDAFTEGGGQNSVKPDDSVLFDPF